MLVFYKVLLLLERVKFRFGFGVILSRGILVLHNVVLYRVLLFLERVKFQLGLV